MKNSILVGAMCLISGLAHAGSFPVEVANVANTTNSVTYGTVAGKINTIVIDVTGVTTGTVTVTSARTGEAFLTTTVSADAVKRPRVSIDTVLGAAAGAGTNALEMFYLSNDTLTFSVAETAPAADSTYTITVITE